MENIHVPQQNNVRSADIVTAVIPGLVMADQRAADKIDEVARDMRITTAPKHPGQDPVSTHIVEQLVSVLRGDGGLAPRLRTVTERLRRSAERLAVSQRRVHAVDQVTAETLARVRHERRP